MMNRKIAGMIMGAALLSGQCFAMTFSQPIELGGIGIPVQAPYEGYIVEGATQNSGKPHIETSKYIVGSVQTYKKGIARWGEGVDALYCDYVYDVPPGNSDSWKRALRFGGKNNYIVYTESLYRTIYKIDTDEGQTLYSIARYSGSEEINIIGRQKDGKWVSYINSNMITEKFFNGVQAYKGHDGVHYGRLRAENDTLIIPYSYQQKHEVVAKGEFRFKWDDKAQWFGIEQVRH